MTSLFYGAWIARASDGGFVAQFADFPEITAIGLNEKSAAMLASVRLSAHVAGLRQRGAVLPAATGASELMAASSDMRLRNFLEVREPTATMERAR